MMHPVAALLLIGLVAAEPARDHVGSAALDSTARRGPAVGSPGDGWVPYDYGRGARDGRVFSSGQLVLLAFGLIWAVLFGYGVILVRRQRRLLAELQALQSSTSVAVHPPAGPKAGPREEAGGREP